MHCLTPFRAALTVLLLPTFALAVPFMNDNLVIRNAFDGDLTNSATGTASAGSLGDANPVTIGFENGLEYITGQSEEAGQALFWGGFDEDYYHLEYADEAIQKLVEAGSPDGFTMSMFAYYDGDTQCCPSSAPAWFFNARTQHASNNIVGMRVNPQFIFPGTGGMRSYRAPSPGGFLGFGGVSTGPTYNHIALTVVPDGGNYRAKFYYDGGLLAGGNGNQDQAALFTEITTLDNGLIGAWALDTSEWRLHGAAIDEFRLYNTGMTDEEIFLVYQEHGGGGDDVIFPPGDYNSDGDVALPDLNLVLFNWNEVPPVEWTSNIPALVDVDALNNVLFNWGTTGPPLTSVPEPSTAVTVILGILGSFWLASRRGSSIQRD